MLVSVRIEKSGSISGQMGHDFNSRPSYADSRKIHLNQTLFGGSVADVEQRIADQSRAIYDQHADHVVAQRGAINALNLDAKSRGAELRKIRSWRSDAVTHKTMIVTFDNDFYLNRNQIDRAELDRHMIEFTDLFCRENSCEISYIVRHEDETTPHYHATFTNYNRELKTTHKFKQADLSVVQDMAGEKFSPMGINRGIKKNDRIAEAKKQNPQQEGESEDDYKYRIKKIANVIHRGLVQLKSDVPRELARLYLEVENLQIAISKGMTNLARTQSDLSSERALSAAQIKTLRKREAVYINRIAKHEEKETALLGELENLEQKKSELQGELQCNLKKIDVIKQTVCDRVSEANTIIAGKNAEIKKLAAQPAPVDYTETFEVKTGTFTAEKMELIRPTRYQKIMKKMDADKKDLSAREKLLTQLNKTLKRGQMDLISDREKLQNRINDFDGEVKKQAGKLLTDAGDSVYEKLSKHALGMLNHGIKTHTLVTGSNALSEEQMRFYTSEMGQRLEQNMRSEISEEIPAAIRDVVDDSGWSPG